MSMQRLAPAATALAFAAVGVSPAFAQQAPVVRGGAAEMRVLRPLNGEVVAPSVFFLEVSFQSKTASRISAAELYVDGVRWARRDFETALTKYVLSFEVDGRTLTGGEHKVRIKLVAEDGGIAETELPLLVDGPKAAPTLPTVATNRGGGYGPTMSFRGIPKKLTGTVDIELSIKEESLSPYVSFFVDNQFKTLKNYPPYSFAWDTTAVTNGYHIIKATGYLESTGATSEQRIQVYVDNPGGFTARATTPDKNPRAADTHPDTAVKPTTPLILPAIAAPEAVAARPSASGRKPGEPIPVSLTALKEVGSPSLAVSGAISPLAPGALRAAERRVIPATTLSEPEPSTMGLAAPGALVNASVGRPASVAPMSMAAPHTGALAVSNTVVRASHKNVSTAARPTPHLGGATFARMPEMATTFNVNFDGTAINFDVAPRVENGLPLAPFRQIFEHTGGTIEWGHKDKTVHATNSERDIFFAVGGSAARVNGKDVTLDHKSFIERGRAIVPLSFVGQALDVKVDFDPLTGRLQITSQK